MEEMEQPKKEIDFKMATPEQAYWERVLKNTETDTLNAKNSIIINEKILELAKEKLEECKKQTKD